MAEKMTTSRRSAQQIVHCAQEALSCIERQEDPRHVVADLSQARDLIDHLLKTWRDMAKGADRA